ncbi:MAG: hypothetical protein AB7N80_09010 [Bdellovibrionales bacterium]
MKSWMWRLIAMISWMGPVGCSDVGFKSQPNKLCVQYQNDFGSEGCVLTPDGFNQFNYHVNVGEVDILVVNDNSTSMYVEQSEMALRFPGFLDSIYRLDYRLGMITTDTRAAFNGGGLLTFPNGQKMLANSSRVMDATHQNNITWFQNTVKRQETLDCQASGYTSPSCPSGDERGIFAMNMALDRTDQRGFFRPGGHLAVIILSDEDERSNGGNISGYPLENYDMPLTFVQKTKQILGATKTVSVHSIIIRPTNDGANDSTDIACYNAQNNQGSGVKGFVGTQYAALSNPSNALKAAGNIIDGTLGNICSNNYTTELGNIASKINQTLSTIQLPCKPEQNLVDVSFNPAPAQQVYYTIDADNRIQLNPAAPAGTRVNLKFKCKI